MLQSERCLSVLNQCVGTKAQPIFLSDCVSTRSLLLHKVLRTSQDTVFLSVAEWMLSMVGMKLVPLFNRSLKSSGRLMVMKL